MDLNRRDASKALAAFLISPSCFAATQGATSAYESAKSASPLGLKLITPADPQFGTLLQERLLSIVSRSLTAKLLPFSALVRNTNSFQVKAFLLNWTLSESGKTYSVERRYLNRPTTLPLRHRVSAALPALHKDEVALVTPFFSISETRIRQSSLWGRKLPIIDGVRQKKLISNVLRRFTSPNVSVAATGLLAGRYVRGVSGVKLAKRYCLYRNAEHDLARNWQMGLDNSLTAAALAEQIESDIASLRSNSDKGNKKVYTEAQMYFASQLQNLLLTHGKNDFLAVVEKVSRHKRDRLHFYSESA